MIKKPLRREPDGRGAPFWIFNLAAVNIDNEVFREALGLKGVVLGVFGLLYGGVWRIQMRKRYNLPLNNFSCGNPPRMIVPDGFSLVVGVKLPCSSPSRPGMINSPSPSRFSKGYDCPDRQLPIVMEESSVRGNNSVLTPPTPSLIQREDV
ncbi:hypothetical protein IFM89_002268 [Coptis chinensis]|uniref:Uncharacterized protein n=1 Tax=Coptis chinensis TaxID=261450 RepID=A0A835IL58_9MAGN|nr:hypothetical protein IFM89_002268 [Coptis chinensis]